MKIALVNNVPPIWGLGKYAFKLHNSLKKLCDIDNIYMDLTKRILKVNEKDTSIGRIPLLDNKVFFIYRAAKHFPDYDIYHITNQNLSFIVNKIKRKKSKVIVTCHDVYRHKKHKNFLDLRLSKFLYSGLKRADAIIASTTATKKDLIRYLGLDEKKIFTVNLASDRINRINKSIARKKLGLPLDAKIVMHIGELDAEIKNTYRTAKAVEKLSGKLKILLVRVGKGKYESKNVINLYKISDKEMELLYNASDVLASALTYDLPNLPIIEAMKCGLPIVASKTSSTVEVVGNAAYYVDALSVKEISKGIEKVITNKKLRETLIKRGLKIGKKFTWDNAAKQVLEIYRKV